MYLSLNGGILVDYGRNEGDTGGFMPCVANSQSMLKS